MIIKNKIWFLFSIVFFIGCEFGNQAEQEKSDAELIRLIIEAEKLDIGFDELPEQTSSSINNETEYYGISAKLALGIGYEIERAGRGHRYGHRNEVYFNMQGRKLDPNDFGRRNDFGDRGWRKNKIEDWRCFDLVFPIVFDMPDGSTIEIETDDEEGWSDLKLWYEENDDAEQRPAMQFPIEIHMNEELINISNNEQLNDIYSECDFDWKRQEGHYNRGCFEVAFPITFSMPDGSTIEVETDDEQGWSDLKLWYEENDDAEQRPILQYPVDIIYETEEGDSTVTLNNDGEMETAKEECREDWSESGEWDEDGDWDEEECFNWIYPITFLMPDGSSMTLENEDGWHILSRWYEENGDSEQEPILQYPVDIIYETEEGEITTTLNNSDELESFEEECSEEN